MTIIYFLIALSILIFVHELGHFIVARLSGIRVEKFSLGFGPKIFGIKKGETEYRISALPFGGYVKMTGEDPSDIDKDDKRAFYNKPVRVRAGVVAAGPVMNFLLCAAVMPLVFMIGKFEPAFFSEVPVVTGIRSASPAARAGIVPGDVVTAIDGRKVSDWKEVLDKVLVSTGQDLRFTLEHDGKVIEKGVRVESMPEGRGGYIGIEPDFFVGNEPVLDMIEAASPAEKAGLMPGDRVVAIYAMPVNYWTDIVEFIQKARGWPIFMTVARGDDYISVALRPKYNKDADRYLIGIGKDMSARDIPMVKVRHGFFESVYLGIDEVGRLSGLTFTVLGRLFTGKLSYKSLGGPVMIAKASAAAAKTGLGNFIWFLSFLSLQLGILNLLPVPVLDGGHLAFFGIEAVRRKPLSERVMGIAQNTGLILLLILLAFVTYNDVLQLDFVRKIFGK